jgi:hypothetical protein
LACAAGQAVRLRLRSRTSRIELSSDHIIVAPFADDACKVPGEVESIFTPAITINANFDEPRSMGGGRGVFCVGVAMPTVLNDALSALPVGQFVLEALHPAVFALNRFKMFNLHSTTNQ